MSNQRLNEREAQLIADIKRIQQESQTSLRPLAEELVLLREHRDGRLVEFPDGKVFEYTGPRPDYKLPEERQKPK